MATNQLGADDALGLLRQAITIAEAALSSENGNLIVNELTAMVPAMMTLCDELDIIVAHMPSGVDYADEHRLGAYELLGVQ